MTARAYTRPTSRGSRACGPTAISPRAPPTAALLSTGEVYAALEHVPEVVDALAFAQAWDGDTRMVLLVVLAPGAALDDDLRGRIRSTLRERGSPRHVPAVLAAVPDLPRTLTGKLAEIAAADTVNARPVRNRDALANPESLDVIAALEELRA